MKVHVPFIGKVTGSSAGLIYQSYWGKSFARTFPALFHYPDTPSQQQAQAKFYEIQKIWNGIYADLKTYIGPSQKKNKNPYNVLSKYIYRVLNPYNKALFATTPKYFGFDPLNRVRASIGIYSFDITEEYINLTFAMNRPYIGIDVEIKDIVFLFFNRSRKDLAMSIETFDAMLNKVQIHNDNEWKNRDICILYIALAGPNYLANFNRNELYFR